MTNMRPPAKPSGSMCELCGSTLMNAADGWPTANQQGCIGSYHDGGYGSVPVPGYCGKMNRQWHRGGNALADQYNAEVVRRLHLESVLDELLGESEQREQDRVYAFCIHGLGHDMVQVDPPDPSVGIFGVAAWCERCGTDLSDDELINPVEVDL